jgi:glycosyltransferase involved in cell wall biosynthesis
MSLHVTIITVDIGTGLGIDARILGDVLHRLGDSIEIQDLRSKPRRVTPADCAIFLERYDPRFAGRFNVMIANPEWIRPEDAPRMTRFELVACKTREAMRVMSAHVATDRLIYTGWTTVDRYRPEVARSFGECLHIAGCSEQKGTDAILCAWRDNPDLPKLTVIDWRSKNSDLPDRPNLRIVHERVDEKLLLALMNGCSVHLCPSVTEGFGHTIHEAMACGAVLITADAPPMNEQTRDCAVLMPTVSSRPMGLATAYDVSPSGIAAAVRKVMAMSGARCQTLGSAARNAWEQNRAAFGPSIENMVRIIEQRIQHSGGVFQAPAQSTFGSNMFRA